MRKIIILVLVIMIVSIAACQKQVRQSVQGASETQSETAPAQPSGDAAADSFGNDVGSANTEDGELSSSQLDGADSGFEDIGNM